MAAVIPLSERKKIDNIQKDLRSSSLLEEEDESFKEGFYPIRIDNFYNFYSFLTPRQIISWADDYLGGKTRRSESIPFNNIKEISMKNERNRQVLINLILVSVVLPVALFILSGAKSLSSHFDNDIGSLFEILFWVGLILFPILLGSSFYRYVKGEPIITLMVSGKPLKIGYQYSHLFQLRSIYFFTITGTEVNSQGHKGGIAELYHLLLNYYQDVGPSLSDKKD